MLLWLLLFLTALSTDSLTAGMQQPFLIGKDVQVLVLCGYPGCGKTTLASSLAQRGWFHVSQDVLGNRRACERAARAEILAGRRVVVDRCNQDAVQRSHWTRMAPSTVVVWLDAEVDVCVERVLSRPSHPTLPPLPSSVGIVKRFATEFVPPTKSENGVNDVLRIRVPFDESVDSLAMRLSPPPPSPEERQLLIQQLEEFIPPPKPTKTTTNRRRKNTSWHNKSSGNATRAPQ